MATDLQNWEPLSPDKVRDLLAGLAVPWWIAGGWAIDLFVGRQTRKHEDTDVLVLRNDQLGVQAHLAGWDLLKAQPPGRLVPWEKGEFLRPGVHDIWCRRTPESPWSLQLMLMDTDGDRWVFRRDPSITGPLATLGRRTDSGIPYLAPEIQLLCKAKAETLAKDDADFEVALPLLGAEAKRWLLACLGRRFPGGHTWVRRLSA